MKLLIAEVVWTWSARTENPERAKLFSRDIFLQKVRKETGIHILAPSDSFKGSVFVFLQ